MQEIGADHGGGEGVTRVLATGLDEGHPFTADPLNRGWQSQVFDLDGCIGVFRMLRFVNSELEMVAPLERPDAVVDACQNG